ncbi:MAG: hypothetical protein AAF497_14365 [Planctomycetota bacterium]
MRKPTKILLIAGLLAVFSSQVSAVNFLLNSFEDGLEGWQDSFGGNTDPLSVDIISGVGNTDGNNALQFTVLQNGFEWSVERFLNEADFEYQDFVTALANPAFHKIEYDLTYDLTWSNPDPNSDFFNIGISLSVQEGAQDVFHQGFGLFGIGGGEIAAAGGNVTGTATVGQQLSDFSLQPFQTDPLPGFIRPIIPVNGTFDAPATFYIDNIRVSEAGPAQDLDADLDVDLDDFDVFMMWHRSDFTGLDAETALSRGDFDGDFDSDFDDFLLFEQTFDLVNGAGAFRAAVPEPSSGVLTAYAVR